jgi:hypothetical protein
VYVFDSSPLIILFRHYYPDRFPTLWENFESLKADNKIISVREVFNEINVYGESDRLTDWAKKNREFFEQPTIQELLIVTEVFKNNHFQALIRRKERLQGKPVADPFVAAKAKVLNGTVVTNERFKDNAAGLPNVCEKFEIPCINLEEFMKRENWIF